MQIVKRLSEEDYKMLLSSISTDKFSKPHIVLETARNKVVTDAQMIEILEINPSTYYTLKSRLHSKVAAVLSKKVENPISVLMNEVSRVPSSLFGTNKQVAIRSLKELEKQLLEYDLSNELIIVYHSLARLHMYREEYLHYQRLYNKFVAFALASEKAENIYYDFLILVGEYQLSYNAETLDRIESSLREMSNIAELYNSHRLFVYFNIMRIYFMLITVSSSDALILKEMEIDSTLKEIKVIFDKYPLDTFYTNIKFIVEAFYFEYYQKINNLVRAGHHYKIVVENIAEYASHYILNFHIIQFLNAKIAYYIANRDDKLIKEKNDAIIHNLYVETEELYNFICFQKYLAIVKFYEGNYSAAASIINSLRSSVNLKPYWFVDTEFKLFQAFQYAILKEEVLCRQLIGNIERSLRSRSADYKNIKLIIKLLKASFLSQDSNAKQKKLTGFWDSFKMKNTGMQPVLTFLMVDEKIIQKMARK